MCLSLWLQPAAINAASLVICGGKLVNVISGEILEGMSVAVQGGRIAYVGKDVSHTIGAGTQVIDAAADISLRDCLTDIVILRAHS